VAIASHHEGLHLATDWLAALARREHVHRGEQRQHTLKLCRKVRSTGPIVVVALLLLLLSASSAAASASSPAGPPKRRRCAESCD